MSLHHASEIERINFLFRVIEKEIKLVHIVADKLFTKPFTIEIAYQLDDSADIAISLEAFII